jgi:predicted ATPase/class 3 adenylate cyclase
MLEAVGAADGPGRASATHTLTFLFSDIEGSSRLEREVGTAAYAALRARHQALLRAAFVAEGGDERGTEGDSFFVVFPSAGAAVRAAVAAQRALAAEPWPPGASVRVRIGIHTGDAMEIGDEVVGIDINRAARIAAAGHGGQIVLSDLTGSLVEQLPDGVTLRDLGIHRLKDFDPIRLHDLVVEGLPTDFPRLRSGGSPFAGLPAQPTTFLGRSREVGDVRALLVSGRLLTLTGPGGTGKTRLSIAAAQAALGEFPGGVAWVGLSSIADPALVGPAIAGALTVVDEGVRPLVDVIVERIGRERILLVIDNFEQVEPAAPLVGRLLDDCPNLTVLVTSRGRLHLVGEQEYPVPPLPLPDPSAADPAPLAANESVALFVERARAVRPEFALDASNASAVAAICARLEGLPLAIELAAARVRLLSPAAIRDRLDSSLGLLTGGARDLPDRQRTLRGAVAWSNDLLDPAARTLFARLSVFAGGTSLEAAEAVVDHDGSLGIDVLEGIEALVDESLIRPADSQDGEPRFRMLHVIREFGLERLAESGEMDGVRDAHLAYFASLAERAEPELIGSDSARWLDRIEREHDNVRVALRWAIDSGQLELGLTMAGRLWRFWHQRAHIGEGLAMLRELLGGAGPSAPTFGRAKAMNGAGGLAYWQNDFPAARAYYEEHLALVRAIGDTAGEAEALMNLAFMEAIDRRLDAAFSLYEQSADLYRAAGDRRGEAAAVLGLGMSYSMTDQNERALEVLDEAVRIAEAAGDRYRSASARGVVARIHLAEGDLAGAAASAREALDLFAGAGDLSGTAMEVWDLAEIATREGRPRRALVLAAASLAIRDRLAGGAPTELSQSVDVVAEAGPQLAPDERDSALADGRRLGTSAAGPAAFAMSDADTPETAAS